MYSLNTYYDPVYRLHHSSSDFDQPISLVPKSFRIPLSHSSNLVTSTFFTPYRIAFCQVIGLPPTCPLHRVLTNNTCLRCMTASAGTIIRRDYSFINVILLMKFRPLQQMLSSVFGVAGSGFRPLTKILDCCLPLKSGPFSVPVRRYCLSTPLSIIGLVSFYPTNYHQKLCHFWSKLISNTDLIILFLFRYSFPYTSFQMISQLLPNVLLCPKLLYSRTPSSSHSSLLICNV